MARRGNDEQAVAQLLQLLLLLPRKVLYALIAVAVIGLVIYWYVESHPRHGGGTGTLPAGSTLMLCSWNAENFFDDEDDPKSDDEEENRYGRDPALFAEKVDHLSDALLLMNDGNGPDIIALVEVESERCLNAMRESLNAKLTKANRPDKAYGEVVFRADTSGRRFAPGFVTRLAVVRDRTRRIGPKYGLERTLEAHFKVNGHELTVISSHWTSRLRDGSVNRMRYAEACHGRIRAILEADPAADVILCGDFNDGPTDPSVTQGLKATTSLEQFRQSTEKVRLLDLCGKFDGSTDPKGTIYGKSKWSTFDHVVVSPGMIDAHGWGCDPSGIAIFAPRQMRHGNAGEPFRFYSSRYKDGEHGYSDHFPLILPLRLGD